jgi:hypothetical protein
MCPAAHKVELCFPVTPTSGKLHVGGFAWQLKDLYRLLTQKDVSDDNSSPHSHKHKHYKTCSARTKSITSLRVRPSFDCRYKSTVPLNISLQWDFCRGKWLTTLLCALYFSKEPSWDPPKTMSFLETENTVRLGLEHRRVLMQRKHWVFSLSWERPYFHAPSSVFWIPSFQYLRYEWIQNNNMSRKNK